MDGQQALTAADATDATSGLSGEHNGEQLESQNNPTKSSPGDKARTGIKTQGPLICVVSCD